MSASAPAFTISHYYQCLSGFEDSDMDTNEETRIVDVRKGKKEFPRVDPPKNVAVAVKPPTSRTSSAIKHSIHTGASNNP